MSVLSDKWIRKMSLEKDMISPFVEKQQRSNNISYGLSSFGYDARVSNEFKIFTNVNSGIVDPKVFKKDSFVTKIGKECIIPPNSFALARTMEYFKIPDNVLVICLGKSTYRLEQSRLRNRFCNAIEDVSIVNSEVIQNAVVTGTIVVGAHHDEFAFEQAA